MTNTTATYWDIDDISLNTYAYNIATLGGGRTNVPDLRGSNVTVPYRRGDIYIPKIADSREITLAMWISAFDDDGDPPTDGNIEAAWQKNFDKLRNLIWREGEEFTLTKRFWRDGNVEEASAKASFVRGLEPTMDAPGLGRMTVTLLLSDPFFYGEEKEVELTPGTEEVEVDGDTFTTNILLEMEAGVSIVNQEGNPDISIFSSVAANIDVHNKKVNGLASPAIINTSGSDQWFLLYPGSNTVVTSGGDATMTYRPAYF